MLIFTYVLCELSLKVVRTQRKGLSLSETGTQEMIPKTLMLEVFFFFLPLIFLILLPLFLTCDVEM